MKKGAFIFFLLICIKFALADIVINEIMYNPNGTDEYREWIEIYNSGNNSINLSGWKFYESGTNHGLNLINNSWELCAGCYAVISDDSNKFLLDYPDFNGTLFDSSFSLSNTGEYIALKNSSLAVIDEVNYSSSWGGNSISLERISPTKPSSEASNWADSLVENGTPGRQNSLFGTCDWSIEIIADRTIWEMENSTAVVKWKIKVEEASNEGEVNFSYWIEDSSGQIVKSNIDKSSNSSDIFGYYQKTFHHPGGYIIKAVITNASCNDYNLENNIANTAIIVLGEGQTSGISASFIEILEVSPTDAKFGDIIKVKINVYRGDTAKYAVYAYIENSNKKEVSEKSIMHFKDKFTNYTLTIPIQLKPNCDEDYKDGKHTIIVEGLDVSDTALIEIEGTKRSMCKESSSDADQESSSSKSFSYYLEEKPESIESGKEFEIKVNLKNEDKQSHKFDVWSYIYRGSKCYSGDRKDNLKKITIPAQSSKIIILKNIVKEAEPGSYNLKIKILRDDYKTEKEITETIEIVPKEKPEELDIGEKKEQPHSKNSKPFIPNQVPLIIYESTSLKTRKLVPLFIIGLFCFFCIILIWRR